MPKIHSRGDKVREYTIREIGTPGGQAIPCQSINERGDRIFLKQFIRPTPASPDAADFMARQKILKEALNKIPAFVSVILDVFEWDACFYQVSEWVEGTNLEQLFVEGDLDHDTALLNAKVLAYSIGKIHSQGVAHLDLKPGNVIMERKTVGSSVADVFRIIDFDAAIVEGAPLPQEFFGTDYYKSPEHVDPDNFGKPGRHSDIFTLGIMLYQLLAKCYPYVGEWPQCAVNRETTPPHEINPEIPCEISELVWRSLSPNFLERPRALEIHQALLDLEKRPGRLEVRIGSTKYRKSEEFVFGYDNTEFQSIRGIRTVSRKQLRFYRVGGHGPWEVALLSGRVPMEINSEKILFNPSNPPRRRLSKGDRIKVGSVEMVIDSV